MIKTEILLGNAHVGVGVQNVIFKKDMERKEVPVLIFTELQYFGLEIGDDSKKIPYNNKVSITIADEKSLGVLKEAIERIEKLFTENK